MTNNTNDISTDITIDKKLQTVRSFKYLGDTVTLNIWEIQYRMRDSSLKYSPGQPRLLLQ